jgi:hypothetical protein
MMAAETLNIDRAVDAQNHARGEVCAPGAGGQRLPDVFAPVGLETNGWNTVEHRGASRNESRNIGRLRNNLDRERTRRNLHELMYVRRKVVHLHASARILNSQCLRRGFQLPDVARPPIAEEPL